MYDDVCIGTAKSQCGNYGNLLSQKFRESNVLTKEITKESISRNISEIGFISFE